MADVLFQGRVRGFKATNNSYFSNELVFVDCHCRDLAKVSMGVKHICLPKYS